jgi:hypothetical protein
MNQSNDRIPSRAVMTLGLGKAFYFQLACNLARSFRLWHRDGRIKFVLVTDLQLELPVDLRWCQVHRVEPEFYGKAFTPKLSLDRMLVADQTLFIDSDCLVYEPLDRLFDRFSDRAVATVGCQISDGEWFGDVAALCRTLGVRSIPKFNGGLYFIQRGTLATAVYAKARELVDRYDELGLIRLRGHPNDELLMASAMTLQGLAAIPDDGSYMSDPQACPGPMRLNVLLGTRRLSNPAPPSLQHQAWYPFRTVSPTIVHFLGDHVFRYVYRAECWRLTLSGHDIPIWVANLVAVAFVVSPGSLMVWLRVVLRPFFRRLFGVRKVRSTARQQSP